MTIGVFVPTKGTPEWDNAVAAGLIVPNLGGGSTPTPTPTATPSRDTLTTPGTLTAGPGTAKLPITEDRKLAAVMLSLDKPANGDVIVDLNYNNVSLFAADPTKRPVITTARVVSDVITYDPPIVLKKGGYITKDIDQIGGAVDRSYVAWSGSTTDSTTQTVSFIRGANLIDATIPVKAGDIHVATVISTVGGSIGDTGRPTTVIVPPAGWVEAGPPQLQVHNTAARDYEVHTFVWKDDGTNAGPFQFKVTVPSSVAAPSGLMGTFRGASGLDGYASANSPASSSTPGAPSVIATSSNEILVCAFMSLSGSTAIPTLPTGFAYIGTGTGRTLMAYKMLTDAGGTGVQALTGAAGTATRWVQTSTVLATSQTGAAGSTLTTVLVYSA